ncbi:MAG: hypothetical protein ABI347_11035 [Nitrososphaera sp.]
MHHFYVLLALLVIFSTFKDASAFTISAAAELVPSFMDVNGSRGCKQSTLVSR